MELRSASLLITFPSISRLKLILVASLALHRQSSVAVWPLGEAEPAQVQVCAHHSKQTSLKRA